jgi:adenylate cyclase
VTRIIVAHGGMIDKFVGDAVHALFNVPFDLDAHPQRAVDCAVALKAWTEKYRHVGLAGSIGLGRTRIGVETGEAIVGDVGLGTKVDYTAHGDAVNTAARLEALNKEFGSSICVGPAAAARCTPGSLRPLGTVEIRGIGQAEVFTPVETG